LSRRMMTRAYLNGDDQDQRPDDEREHAIHVGGPPGQAEVGAKARSKSVEGTGAESRRPRRGPPGRAGSGGARPCGVLPRRTRDALIAPRRPAGSSLDWSPPSVSPCHETHEPCHVPQ
jgi:hypothetical protein